MYTESKIVYVDGNFRWLHEIVGDTILLMGDDIVREKLIQLIKDLSDCSHVCIYRKDNGSVDLALTFNNWVMLDSIRHTCALFGEDYRFCNVAFYPNGDCINVRMTLFANEDIPF